MIRLLRNPPVHLYPTAAAETTLAGAVHVIRGDSPGGALKAAGASPILCVSDNLAVGPSSLVPTQHGRLRLRYWRTEWADAGVQETSSGGDALPPHITIVSAPELGRALLAGERGQVVLWASGAWSDLLFLGWALDAVARAGVAPDRIRLAGPCSASFPLGYLNPEQLARFGASPQALGERRVAALRRLWKAFTSTTPGPLEQLREVARQALPTLQRESAYYAAFLPRTLRRNTRRLRLPEIDETLLSALSEREWRSLADLLRAPLSRARWPTSAVFAMLRVYGEFFIVSRLLHWSRLSSGAVECVEWPGRHPLAFRLTARGRRILDRGIDDVAALPRTQVGGHQVASTRLWVCAMEREGWNLRRG